MRYAAALVMLGCSGGAHPVEQGRPEIELSLHATVPARAATLIERKPCRVTADAVLLAATGHGQGTEVRFAIDRVLRYRSIDPVTAVYDPPLPLHGLLLYLETNAVNDGDTPLDVDVSVELETSVPIACVEH